MTTALQDKNLAAIKESGGVALVINEDNVASLTAIIKIMEIKHGK